MSNIAYKKQELLTHREHQDSRPVFSGILVAHRFSFLWCDVFCLSSSCVLHAQCCQCLWIIVIAPSVFSNVYLRPNVYYFLTTFRYEIIDLWQYLKRRLNCFRFRAFQSTLIMRERHKNENCSKLHCSIVW